jgi:TonB family C-terminal domain
MKNSLNLNSTEWCDIIFEGKNKSYGAFELRQSSWKRHLVAFGIILTGVVFIAFLPSIISTIEAATKTHVDNINETYTVMQVDNKMEEPQPEILNPELPEPPKYIEMKKFVPPTISNDEEVTEVMTGMDDLIDDKRIAIGVFDVKEGSTDEDAIRKIFEEKVVEGGTGKGQGKKEEILIGAEQMPQFPGGSTEMYKYIYDNLKYPVVDQEMGIQGKVTVRFVVTKTGDISGVELLKGISPTCDKEAMRVIKGMPKWIPGKQNGTPVAVYFTIPITYKLKI